MNNFKFTDCKDCKHLGFGSQIKQCVGCRHGENFEEKVTDTVEFMKFYELVTPNE